VTYKAIIFDYIGTLVEPRDYSLETSREKLHVALQQAGLEVDVSNFKEAYRSAHEKYRKVRYEKLREVTNAIWVSEALCNSGCKTTVKNSKLKEGLNIFFQDFVDSLILRKHAKNLLRQVTKHGKVGLISNFTYAPAIYASLRKLGLGNFFNAVVISESVGWRKPHRIIFEETLKTLRINAGEAVYVGDSPVEDIGGAAALGLKTVFVPSHFYSVEDLARCGEKPDVIVEDLLDFSKVLPEVLKVPKTRLHHPT